MFCVGYLPSGVVRAILMACEIQTQEGVWCFVLSLMKHVKWYMCDTPDRDQFG